MLLPVMFFKKITASSSVFNANIKLLFSAFTFEALFPFEFSGKMYITAKPALTILHIWKTASILYWPLYDGWPRITVFSVGELPWVLACVQTSPPPSGKNRRRRRGRLYTGYGCQPFFFLLFEFAAKIERWNEAAIMTSGKKTHSSRSRPRRSIFAAK